MVLKSHGCKPNVQYLPGESWDIKSNETVTKYIKNMFHFSSSTTSYHHSSSNTHHQTSSSSSTGDTNVSSNMLQHAAHGQQSHGQHHQNHPNQHHSQQHSSYHLNPNNSNLIGGAADGGMFNDREAHSMLESVVKGNQNHRIFVS